MPVVVLLLAVFVLILGADGRVLPVPSGDFPTIQSAIDSSASGDTVLIAAGRYAEALIIEGRSITLLGETAPDSTLGTGVIIDPAPLDSANMIACASIVGGDSVAMKNIWFRNGEAMHIERPLNQIGGIDNRNGPVLLTLADCRFDSVYRCIKDGGVVRLTNVRIVNCQRSALTRGDSTRFEATDCLFHGNSTLYMVLGWSGTRMTRCTFRNENDVALFAAAKDSIVLSACRFGPLINECGEGVIIRAGSGTVVENCLFEDMQVGFAALYLMQASCSTEVPNWALPIIRGNVFRNITRLGCQGGQALQIHCDGAMPHQMAIVEGNRFINVQSPGTVASAVFVDGGGVSFYGNFFEDLGPDGTPAVFEYGITPPESVVYRNNSFDGVDYAVRHNNPGQFSDARWNWWGDNSGPFNALANPNGQGAQVDNNVSFDPWLTHPDTSVEFSEEQPVVAPQTFRLSVSPNPFNAATTLGIEVPQVGEYVVKLYDVTGRLVKTVFAGRIERNGEVRVAAGDLPSGVYFAQLRSERNALTVVKLLLLK